MTSTTLITESPCVSLHWVELLSALSTPTIAIVGLLIAFMQWRTNRNRSRNDLFDRRYAMFEIINEFLLEIERNSNIDASKFSECLQGTLGIEYIYGKDIKQFIKNDIVDPANRVVNIDQERKRLLNKVDDAPIDDHEQAQVDEYINQLNTLNNERRDLIEKLRTARGRLRSKVAPFLTIKH